VSAWPRQNDISPAAIHGSWVPAEWVNVPPCNNKMPRRALLQRGGPVDAHRDMVIGHVMNLGMVISMGTVSEATDEAARPFFRVVPRRIVTLESA
jgi:hypothetical protein